METNDERLYRRRKTRFQQLQRTKDLTNERLFVLSNDKPWEVFCNGYIDGILHRRRLVFERTGNFPQLHQACISGDKTLVRSILHTSGVCVLERDTCGRIALHHAVLNENSKIARRLLRRRDAPLQAHVRDNSTRTALHYVLDKMEVLAQHRRRRSNVELRAENKRYRHLWELADKMLEMFSGDVLEDRGAGESIRELDMRCRGDLWDVCRSGDLKRLETIVRIFGCSEDQWELSELKRTLLHEACENRQLQVIYFLLSTVEIPVQTQDSSGCTALHCAARRGYFDVCKLLLEKFTSYCGEEILENGSVDDLILLQDKCGRTALHWSLAGFGDSIARCQIAKLLATTWPETLHIYDQDGVSLLHVAIRRGDLQLVQEFIHLGANVCALSSVAQPNYREYPEKAHWAPCGIVFQRRELKSIEKLARVQPPDEKIVNGTVRAVIILPPSIFAKF